ncbi:hypothetical protein [Streptomyces sp. NRRL S-350]|uniref:hypothetical protein n=1 Tax=Streptomyces sp. NRRL S-350 TaxID=1463902 RepID=UPI0004BE8D1C|nr:hypothetical protein [Streptomyces sp. NRRL S-350]
MPRASQAAPFLGAIACTVADALSAGTALYLEYGFPPSRGSYRLILREPKLMPGGQLTGSTAAADQWLLPLSLNRLLIAQRARRR